jgi:hypothetical protein
MKNPGQAPRAPRLRLWQEITLVLVIKAVTLAAIWWAWFAQPQDKRLDGGGVAESIAPGESAAKPAPLLPEIPHAPRPGTR